MTLEAIRYRAGSLQILNQLLLPRETVHEEIRSVQDGYEAIKSMKVSKEHQVLALFRPFFPVAVLVIYLHISLSAFLHETAREER